MGLEVQIGADNSEFKKKIQEVERDVAELSKIKLDRIKLGLDTSEITANIKDAKKALNDLKTATKDSGQSFTGMAPKVASGSNALMQFSRIAQDAPYGWIGIVNNLTASGEAFGHLTTSAGSAGGALKAIGSSMLGSGGVLLAFSLVTSAITYMSQKGISLGDVLDMATGKFDEFGSAIKKASEEGVKDTAGEVFGLKALVSASQNKALSDKERLIAVENLQKQYPGYFGNLSKEQIMTSDLSGTVMELTKALINRSIAEKLAGASADIQLGIYKKNAVLVKQKNITAGLELKLEKDLADAKKANGTSEAQLAIIRAKGINAINASKEAEQEARIEIIKGTKAIEQRQNVINQLTASSIKLDIQAPKAVKAPKALVETPKVSGLDTGMQSAGLADTSGMIVQIAKNVQGAEGMITTSMGVIRQTFDMSGVAMLESLKELNAGMNDIIQNGISNTFADLANVIGTGLATGANIMQSLGGVLLGGFGGILQELGKLLIKTGVGILAAKIALQSMNPYLAIAGGIALVAAGAAFSSGSKSIGNSIGGGSGGGGGSVSTGASVSSPTSSTGSGGGSSFNGGTVVFEISGQSLIGVLSNTLDKNRRLGGSLVIG